MNHIVLNVLLNWWCIQFGVVPGSYASAVAPVYYQQRQGNNLSIISLRLLVLAKIFGTANSYSSVVKFLLLPE